jgi:hypothetical protein
VSFFFLIALAIGLVVVCSARRTRTPLRLSVKVMTYNIHGGRGGVGETVPALEGLERWPGSWKSIARSVLIQEFERGAERSQKVDEIHGEAAIGLYPIGFRSRYRGGRMNYGVAIFSNAPGKSTRDPA